MVRHIDSLHNKKKVRCSVCAKEFSARYVAEHLKAAHGDTEDFRLRRMAQLRENRAKRSAEARASRKNNAEIEKKSFMTELEGFVVT